MAKFISKSQMEKLELAALFGGEGYRKLLREYMGFEARAYTAYNYYDESGDFIGNSEDYDLGQLMEVAGVEVRDGCPTGTAARRLGDSVSKRGRLCAARRNIRNE